MDWILFKEHDKSSPLNSTHCAMLYLQNGDRIVAIDSVTSLRSMYSWSLAWVQLLQSTYLCPMWLEIVASPSSWCLPDTRRNAPCAANRNRKQFWWRHRATQCRRRTASPLAASMDGSSANRRQLCDKHDVNKTVINRRLHPLIVDKPTHVHRQTRLSQYSAPLSEAE